MKKHEWFTLAEAATIWGAKDGITGMVRLILEGNSDFERMTASYILPTPWKAYYIKKIEEPSADQEKWYSPEVKEIWRIDIEALGLIDLDFSGECRNADGSITVRGDGSIKSPNRDWPERAKVYVTLSDTARRSSLHLISTGDTPEELQSCLNIEPEHDLIVTRDHLKAFAQMVGKTSVLTKLKTLPPSGNVSVCEILMEHEYRMDIERKPQKEHDVFDATRSTLKYRVPEGKKSVRLTSTSGHVVVIGEEPRHIPVGLEQEALKNGCKVVQANSQHTESTENKLEPLIADVVGQETYTPQEYAEKRRCEGARKEIIACELKYECGYKLQGHEIARLVAPNKTYTETQEKNGNPRKLGEAWAKKGKELKK